MIVRLNSYLSNYKSLRSKRTVLSAELSFFFLIQFRDIHEKREKYLIPNHYLVILITVDVINR